MKIGNSIYVETIVFSIKQTADSSSKLSAVNILSEEDTYILTLNPTECSQYSPEAEAKSAVVFWPVIHW